MPMTTMPLSLRQVQWVWGVALAFAIVCIVFGGFRRKPFEGSLDWRHGGLLSVATWSAFSGFLVRRTLLNRASSSAKGSNPSASAKTWAAAQLLSIMLS